MHWRSGRSLAGMGLMLVLAVCKGVNTDEYLRGDFIQSSGQNPATLISPPDEAIISLTKEFSWTKQEGARNYRIEFSTSTDFSSPVLRTTVTNSKYTINTADLIGVSSLESRTYYWRVITAYSAKEEISSVFKFSLLDAEIIYVDAAFSGSSQAGTRSNPYKRILDGLQAASLTGRTKVFVAQGTYFEEIVLRPGISLYGGYESSNWTRNIAANTTTVQGINNATITGLSDITAAFKSTTVVDGGV